MARRTGRIGGWAPGLALALALSPFAAGAQAPGELVRPVFGNEGARPRPVLPGPGLPGTGPAPEDLAVGGAPAPVRLYSPAGSEPEPLRAAMLAELARGLRLDGQAVYHPRPAMTVLDVEARVRAAPGVSVSLRLVSRLPLPGRHLPLQYRGRERAVFLGIRVPGP